MDRINAIYVLIDVGVIEQNANIRNKKLDMGVLIEQNARLIYCTYLTVPHRARFLALWGTVSMLINREIGNISSLNTKVRHGSANWTECKTIKHKS